MIEWVILVYHLSDGTFIERRPDVYATEAACNQDAQPFNQVMDSIRSIGMSETGDMRAVCHQEQK